MKVCNAYDQRTELGVIMASGIAHAIMGIYTTLAETLAEIALCLVWNNEQTWTRHFLFFSFLFLVCWTIRNVFT